jgi:hypothetical protein
MNPSEKARADMEREYIKLGRVLQSTLQPGMVQKAALDFLATADHFANTKRETVRGVA